MCDIRTNRKAVNCWSISQLHYFSGGPHQFDLFVLQFYIVPERVSLAAPNFGVHSSAWPSPPLAVKFQSRASPLTPLAVPARSQQITARSSTLARSIPGESFTKSPSATGLYRLLNQPPRQSIAQYYIPPRQSPAAHQHQPTQPPSPSVCIIGRGPVLDQHSASQLYIYHDSCSFFRFLIISITNRRKQQLPSFAALHFWTLEPNKANTATFATWTRSTTVLFFCPLPDPTLSSSLGFGFLLAVAQLITTDEKKV